ncbi:hypothetical protein [Stenotrophomonas phage CM2]
MQMMKSILGDRLRWHHDARRTGSTRTARYAAHRARNRRKLAMNELNTWTIFH